MAIEKRNPAYKDGEASIGALRRREETMVPTEKEVQAELDKVGDVGGTFAEGETLKVVEEGVSDERDAENQRQLKNSLRKLKGLPGVDGSGGKVELDKNNVAGLKPRPKEVQVLKPKKKTIRQRLKSLFGLGSKENSNGNDSAVSE